MTTWEYRVTWHNPHHDRAYAEPASAEWAARERARNLTERGMENVRAEKRPVVAWVPLDA